MSSSALIRWGGLAAMLGGVAWLVDNLLFLAFPQAAWTNAVVIVATLLVLAGLVGFHALQEKNYGRIGRAGFWTVIIASLARILSLKVFLSGSNALIWLAYPVAALGMLVGFVLYGAATLQARVLPRWCGVVLIIAFPVSFLFGKYSGVPFGIVWLALGYMLWSQRTQAANQPSRVS